MKQPVLIVGAMILIVAGAAGLRLACLDNRPMHTDEAVHGIKFGRLLDGEYRYNPHEYHGPTLNYLSIPIARAAGAESLVDVTETDLRLLPALCGIVLVAGVWLLRDALGRGAMLCAGALTAVSPAMIFYSRYYIQEMLLVCFTFFAMVAFWRCAHRKLPVRIAWLAVAGVCLGLMHATKETCIIAFFSMVVAGGCTAVWSLRVGNGWTRRKTISLAIAAGVVLVAGAVVSVTLFSSLFTHAAGPLDSITTYFNYFTRAGGQGSTGNHSHPWYHYLRIVLWWRVGGGTVWTEAVVAILAVVGLMAGLIGRGCGKASIPFVRFLCIYTVVMTAVYSVISYKTPWCLLGFFHGMILLAGLGASVLLRIMRPAGLKTIVAVMLLVATGHLAWQGWKGSFPQCADLGNPYVYAHPTGDVPELVRLVRGLAGVHPDKKRMPVQILCPNDHPWPFPWYLRDFTQVDWYGQQSGQPVLIYPSDMRDDFILKMLRLPPYEQVKPKTPDDGAEDRDYWELRPNVRIDLRVNRDLWRQYNASLAGNAE